MGTFPGVDRVCWWVTTYNLSSVNWEVSHFFLLILVKETSRELYLAYIVHVTFLLNEAALEASPVIPAPNFGAHMYLPEWHGMALLWWPKAGSLQLSTLHLLNSHKHNGTQGTTVWTWEKDKWIRVQMALAELLSSVPIIHIRDSQSPDAQLRGYLTPLVSEHTHLHSHPHVHCQTLTYTHYFITNKIKIERVSGFNCFIILEQRGCRLNL